MGAVISSSTQAQNLFEPDYGSNNIYKFTPSGVQSTFASGLNEPNAVAFDSAGNLFEADFGSGNIFEFTSTGHRSTFASGLSNPNALAFDSAGNLFEADYGSGNIFEFTPGGGRSTFASGLSGPIFLAFDSAGNLFVTDSGTNNIYEFPTEGGRSVFAGLDSPGGLAFDSAGNLFVTGFTSGNIYKFAPAGGVPTIFASGLNHPGALAFDSAGNLFEGDSGSGNIYKFTPERVRSTFASGLSVPSFFAFAPTNPPTVTTDAATSVTSSSAIFNGMVNPNGLPTNVRFEYGITTSYGSSTASQSFNGSTTQSVRVMNIPGLSANTTYHVRLVGTNVRGTSLSYDVTFHTNTPGPHPVIMTNPATIVTPSSARLNGRVNPKGLTTSVYFQYGASASYGFIKTLPHSYTGDTMQSVSADIAALGPNTTYHFRLVGTNSEGTSFGDDSMFTTSPADVAPVINSPGMAATTVDQLFIYQITAAYGPTSYTAAPVPQGMTFDGVRGILAGTPTNVGTTYIQLTASNSHGMGTRILTLGVQPSSGLTIASGTSITARTEQFFSFEVFTTGGSANARLTATHLPPGLSADPETGLISGTPTANGSFAVTLTVTDGSVRAISTLQLTFTSDPAIPVITSPREAALAPGQSFYYRIFDSSQQSSTTFSIIGQLPPGLTLNPATGIISGVYNPRVFQNGGALLGSFQTNCYNISGNATNTLNVFQTGACSFLKISTRGVVQTANNELTGGVYVFGIPNEKEQVMVRAIGPSLRMNGMLQDPTLELQNNAYHPIALNDNWRITHIGGDITRTSNQVAAIQNSHLAPTNRLESAIIDQLADNNNYYAIVRGKSGTTGTVGSVEFYDLGTVGLNIFHLAQLTDFSTRSLVLTGNSVMRSDFTLGSSVEPGSRVTILLRALGPSLVKKLANGHEIPLPGRLLNPMLELRNAAYGLIAQNDNWDMTHIGGIITSNQVAAIQNSYFGHVSLAPTKPLESAMIVTLGPGNYTAIVKGNSNTTGVAQLEAYILPQN